jgi:hypothetical protein
LLLLISQYPRSGLSTSSYCSVALEVTGTVLQHLKMDSFSQLYKIVAPHLPVRKVKLFS